jgi:hypothetical protein
MTSALSTCTESSVIGPGNKAESLGAAIFNIKLPNILLIKVSRISLII